MSDDQRIRLAAQYRQIERKLKENLETLVTPRTLLRWYQKLIKEKWDYSDKAKRKVGRPRKHKEIVAMVLKMAKENPLLGYLDIANRIKNLGWDISYQTVRNILLAHGLEPSKQRTHRLNWEHFFKTNWNGLFALDFTTVEILTDKNTIETHYLLFVIKLSTREAYYAGRTRYPHKGWVQNKLRHISNPFEGFLKDCTQIIMDNDGTLHPNVVKPLTDIGISVTYTPKKAPNCNAYIERFHQSFKRDALTFVIPRSGSQLDNIVREYMAFYNQERNHQGIDGKIINPKENIGTLEGDITIRARNNETLKYYYRCAA